ncbi:MAG: hypothetical protein HN580_15220 [Deltaproteobacteria bacterium]|nr:hypothetical protein [Deltaproteobacteria bacterium]MBT4267744.1 hypothetical protein [Deltaproteobacteria bacterium]MBT4637510.1 hypothetical protein [Deltaproteobacteria bacterium]MBT6504532.1 hypothetical protein [Deltaproteobacteria bacterium]MBT6614307.1 hypothetical protein [Deltaproteobacteria bacterium]
MEKTFYALRLSARVIDLLLLGLIVLALEKLTGDFSVNIFTAYLFYNLVVAVLNGKSLGKYIFSLTIQTQRDGFKGFFPRIGRELLLILLLPLIFLNFLVISPLPLHDRISGTKVIRDEI